MYEIIYAYKQYTSWGLTIDIYTVDTVRPVHIVWYHEAIAKSTTQDGGMAERYLWAETSVNAFV